MINWTIINDIFYMKRNNKLEYTLCIETTSNICGVALCLNNRIIYENNIDNGLNHSITLFDNIVDSLKCAGIDSNSLSHIKVSSGPGSFTGIRIGVSAALGMSIPYNTPIEYIDTLDTFLHGINTKNSIIISMIDARNERAYVSCYDGTNHNKVLDDQVIFIKDLVNLINKHFVKKQCIIYFVGPGAKVYKNYLSNSLNNKIKYVIKNTIIKSGNLYYSNGSISNCPIINYILASKAERESLVKR